MIPLPLINDRTRTNRSRRRSTGNARARTRPPLLPGLAQQTSPHHVPQARQSQHSLTKQSPQPLQSKLITPAATTKTP